MFLVLLVDKRIWDLVLYTIFCYRNMVMCDKTKVGAFFFFFSFTGNMEHKDDPQLALL